MKGIATKRSTAFMIFLFFLVPFAVWRRYFYRYCLYPFLLVLCPLMLIAQKNDDPFPFHHIEYIGAKQGLNGSAVLWITQDKKGFLWVLTPIALNRYDGYSFQSWSYNANDTNSMSIDTYAGLKEDKFGNLWFSSESSGLYSFDPEHEKFKNYRHQPGIENSLLDDHTYPIAGDDPDGIWVFSRTGLNKFNISTRSFTNFKFDDLISKGLDMWTGNAVLENNFPSGDHEKKLYLVGTKGDIPAISSFNPATGKITNYSGFSVKEAFSYIISGAYCWIEPGFKETIWMGSTDNGIYGFNMPAEKFVKVPVTHPCKSSNHFEGFYSVLEDHAGNLWTTNDNNEVVYYNTKRKKFYFFPIQNKFSQVGGVASFIYEDRNHKIWIANLDGLITIDTDQKNIYSTQHDEADPYSISGDYVLAINRVTDKLFVGSRRCQEFDRNKNQFHEPDFLKKLNTFKINSVESDKKGLAWFMGWNGIIRYDPVSNTAIQIDRFKTDSGDIDLWGTLGYAEDKKGRRWVSDLHHGLCFFDPVSFKAKTYSIFGPSDGDLPFFGKMLMDSSGVIYVQSPKNGFVTFNTNNERFKVYKHDPSDPGSVRQELAFDFIQTKNGLIWFGTSGGGIGVFNPGSEKFKAFTTEDGLIHNFVVSLVLDKRGQFWAGTYGGLSCFTPPEDPFAPGCRISFRNYDVSDGLPSNVFQPASSFCDSDGTLFFGTRFAGLVYFHPDSLKDDEFIPPVYLTGLTVNNKATSLKDSNKILERAIDYTREIVLDHTQNTLSLNFTALNYTHPEKNKYAYKLEPFDKDWIYTDASQRIAAYTNLDPGKYTFKVKGSNNDGVWNETPTELMITIVPPFWQTWWFRTLIFIAVAFILYGIYRYRVQQVVRLQAIRNNIAGDLHDDIGSTLNSISIYSEIAKQQAGKEVPALDVIGQNSRKIIESMSDIVWTINPANDPFEKVITRMRSFAYELLKAKQIEYTFEADDKLNSVSLPMQVRKNFYLIFKEATTNLVKYSGASRVSISLYGDNRNIILQIRDNGKGIPVNHETQGNGLMNMKRRAEEIQARLNINSEDGSGTSVELLLRT